MIHKDGLMYGTDDIALFNVVAYFDAGYEFPYLGTAERRYLDSSGDIRSHGGNHLLQRSLDAVVHGLDESGPQFY